MKTPAFLLFIPLPHPCTVLPKDIEPVTGFDKKRYLSTWYKVARLDQSFEETQGRVSTEYSLNEDGSMQVITRITIHLIDEPYTGIGYAFVFLQCPVWLIRSKSAN
jgi:lipocalin